MSGGITRAFGTAGKAALAYVSVMGSLGLAREFLRIADAAKTVEAQIRVATRETGGFAQAQADVRRISAETRSGLEETAKLYGRIVLNSKELGTSQEDAARATETFIKSLRIAGATTSESASATTQFAQALASGVLRGDELKSILEASPRFARLLAESLGVTVGALRDMGEEGELTAQKLVRALTDKRFTAGIDEEFKVLPVTFEQAMQQVENAATITFGAFDRGGQFSTSIANFVTDGTGGFADLEVAAENFGRTASSELAGVIAVAQQLIGVLQLVATGLNNASFGALGAIANRIPGEALLGPLGLPLYQARNSTSYQSAAIQQRYQLQAGSLGRMFGDAFQPIAAAPTRGAVSPAGGDKPKGRSGPSAETLARRAEQERQRAIRDEMQNQQELLRLQDDLIAARAALATASEDILKFELDRIANDQAEQLSQLTTERRIGDLTEDEYNLRARGVAEEADLQRQLARRRKNEADLAATIAQQAASARDEIGTLELEADLARTREERVELERQILERAYQAEEEAIRQAAAAGEIADLDEALARLKRRRLVDEEMARRANMGPGERYLDDLQFEAENLADSYEEIAVRGVERMNQAFADTITSALGLHGVLGDIVRDLIEIAIRQQVVRVLGQAIFGGGGGGGGFLGGLFGGGGKATPSLKGFASGGSMMIGGRGGTDQNLLSLNGMPMARVSRGETMTISPNQRLLNGRGGGMSVVRLELSGDIDARIQRVSGPVAVEIVRASAPSIVDASANETMRRYSRPRL